MECFISGAIAHPLRILKSPSIGLLAEKTCKSNSGCIEINAGAFMLRARRRISAILPTHGAVSAFT
jgi:hypothetical protein